MTVVPYPNLEFVQYGLLAVRNSFIALSYLGLHAKLSILRPVLEHIICERVGHVLKLTLATLIVGIEKILLFCAAKTQQCPRCGLTLR